MSALPRSYNPFAEEEDEEAAAWPARGGAEAGGAERQRCLQQEVLRRTAATADSTARSLSLLYESERIGVAASEVGRGWGGRRTGSGTFAFPRPGLLRCAGAGGALRMMPPGRGVRIKPPEGGLVFLYFLGSLPKRLFLELLDVSETTYCSVLLWSGFLGGDSLFFEEKNPG